MVYIFKAATIEDMEDDLRKKSLGSYFYQKKPGKKTKIKANAMDIFDRYLASIREHAPQSEEKVVFDRYHLMTNIGEGGR
jgi:transposase